jgi:hypothetical protein
VEIGTESALFPEKEYINGIFVAVQRLNMNPGPCFSFPGSSTMDPAGVWDRPAGGARQPTSSSSQVHSPAVKISRNLMTLNL